MGVFDGVHRGHRGILKAAVARAHSIKGTSVVLTFWPHPQKEESLSSLEHRIRLFGALGIDVCIVINFNQKFAKITAEDFIEDILIGKLNANYVYIGRNFRFGRGANGDFKTLARLSRIYHFKVKAFAVIKVNNKPISSTYIRRLIKGGRLGLAKKMLSHPFSILGTVVRGDALGRELGFPTANINPHHEVTPPEGVYAVRIIFGGRRFKGLCYIGTKPTFESKKEKFKRQKSKHIEVYIFDFEKNIYGKYLEIQFFKKIRDERKFTSLCLLSEQIKKDVLAAKKMFSRH